jgi:putative acetyltransferase
MKLKRIHIRRAVPDDAPAIASLLHKAFLEFKPLYTEGGFAATALDLDQVLIRMKEGPIWVVEDDGVVLGTVAAILKGDSLYIRGMAVLPEARGSGAGNQLLQEAEKHAGGIGCRRLFLSTTPFLDSAIRLYERAGFRRPDQKMDDLFGTPLFTMEKILPLEG